MESPFAINCVSPKENFVVYSSYVGEKDLFCVNIADVTEIGKNTGKKYTITIYSRLFAVVYDEVDLGVNNIIPKNIKPKITSQPKAYPYLPIVEHIFNKERIGIIELNLSLFNDINSVISNCADSIFDSANKLYVFKNVDVDNDTLNAMVAGGAVVVKTNNPETPADFNTVDVQFSQQDINTYYEQRVSKAYDIAGVPLASGVTSSGGDTGKARLLGGGWENAYTIIKGDIIGCEKTDYMLLKQLLAICHTVPDTKVNELTASQIELHYNINPNDDILSKTQSVTNLYGVGMPEELILKYTNLSLDPCADAKKWVDNVKAKKEEERKVAEENQKRMLENSTNLNGGNDNQIAQNKPNEQIEKNNDKNAE
jgi:SPP1 family phage portal protein